MDYSGSNILKSQGGYQFKDDNARVIDSNEAVAARIELLRKVMGKRPIADADGFTPLDFGALAVDGGEYQDQEEYEEPQLTAEEIIAEANSQAEEILAKARAEAQEILANAQAEAESVFQGALNDGREEGYNTGYKEGLDSFEQKKAELDVYRNEMDEAFEKELNELEPRFIEILTDIYEHIFHIQMGGNKEIVFYLLHNALRKVDSAKGFVVHVSKEDFGFVSMQKKELVAGIAGAEDTQIVEDMTLNANECYIETGAGIFDCSLETQLSGLKRELRLLSYNPQG